MQHADGRANGSPVQQQANGNGDGRFVVRIRDVCEPRLSGGYEGCDCEIPVSSHLLALQLIGALLQRRQLSELDSETLVKPLAGGSRTITLEAVR